MRVSFFTLFLAFIISGCSNQIQKQINVTKNIRSVTSAGFDILTLYSDAPKNLSYECMNYSISQGDLNDMLSQGAKIITSTEWVQSVNYSIKTGNYKGTCFGISYIVEGKKSLLEKYSASK